jgi:WD40 repeat protein
MSKTTLIHFTLQGDRDDMLIQVSPLSSLALDIVGTAGRRTGKVRGGDGDEASSTISDKDIPLESSLILASGSMDPYVYLYDVGAGDGQYEVLQKLSGHTDRVYDVDFHPVGHVLASGSADFSVKVWGRASKRKK